MLNRKNKKGFTLAELLIVVAIIAVLVAIAVPLFVGALDNAREEVVRANKRSIKAMAIAEILENPKGDYKDLSALQPTDKLLATGTVDTNGKITITGIGKAKGDETESPDTTKPDDSGTYTLLVEIQVSEVKLSG